MKIYNQSLMIEARRQSIRASQAEHPDDAVWLDNTEFDNSLQLWSDLQTSLK